MRNHILAAFVLAVLIIALVVWIFFPPETKEQQTEPSGESLPNISVTKPVADEEVGLPLVVEGRARTFENTVNIRLLDANNQTLVETFTTAQSPDVGEFGPFRAALYYPQPAAESGVLEVFQYSARDGSEIDKVTVPVRFKNDQQTLTLQVFFGSRIEDPNSLECDAVYPVNRRVPQTQAVARVSLEQLLAGPFVNEAEQGFFTSINPGVKVQELIVENGTARADFSASLDEGVAGACRVMAIRAQIEQTLKQFSSVSDVLIFIDGRTDDILQP